MIIIIWFINGKDPVTTGLICRTMDKWWIQRLDLMTHTKWLIEDVESQDEEFKTFIFYVK